MTENKGIILDWLLPRVCILQSMLSARHVSFNQPWTVSLTKLLLCLIKRKGSGLLFYDPADTTTIDIYRLKFIVIVKCWKRVLIDFASISEVRNYAAFDGELYNFIDYIILRNTRLLITGL